MGRQNGPGNSIAFLCTKCGLKREYVTGANLSDGARRHAHKCGSVVVTSTLATIYPDERLTDA